MGVDSLNSKHFEARDIKALLDIDKNKLFYWIKTHRLLKPEIEATGTGSKVKFSLKNLLELATINSMSNFGLDLNSIREIKIVIDDYFKDWKEERNVFTDILNDDQTQEDRSIYIYKSKEKLELYYQEQDWDVDGDMDGLIGYAVPDIDQYDGDRPPSPVAFVLRIGLLASELLDQLIKKEY